MPGLIPDNLTYFVRTLRKAGLPVGPVHAIEAVKAVETAGLKSKEDLYWVLHSVLVSKHEQSIVFHEAFHLFFKKRDLIEKMLQILSPVAKGNQAEKEKPKAGAARVSDAFFKQSNNNNEDDIIPEIEIDARYTMSSKDVVREKDFAQMTATEIAEAKRQIAQLRLPVDRVQTRRFEVTSKPKILDFRETVKGSLRSGGAIMLPQFVTHKKVLPPVVALCDISGSMSQYSRIFLHFLHALSEKNRRVHTFLFGTRLTNVTRQLRSKDPDEALEQCSKAVLDWSGGTCIAATMRQFNREWSRRVLGQQAIVLLITDGLERDSVEDLSHEMDRLHRSCRSLIWLNPLLRYDGFQAKAQGIKTMLHHVDDFRAVHSINAMAELCNVLSKPADRRNDPRSWLLAS